MTEEMRTAAIDDKQKFIIRNLLDNVYDIQSVRIAMGNRLVASFREAGLIPETAKQRSIRERAAGKGGTVADDVDIEDEEDAAAKEDEKWLTKILQEQKGVATLYAEKYNSKGSIAAAIREMNSVNIFIQTELDYKAVEMFTRVKKDEESMTALLSKQVVKHPLWNAFFKDVGGCGPLMAAVCIAYLDPYKARWPASFWRYCGLDVIVDENGTHGRTRADAYMTTIIDKNGNEIQRRTLGYNPTVKCKLCGVLAASFLRARGGSHYATLYYDYKNRLMNNPDTAGLKKIIIHRRAIRYAVKWFLADLWKVWRTLEGLPTGDSYAVAKLGMAPHHDPRDTPVQAVGE